MIDLSEIHLPALSKTSLSHEEYIEYYQVQRTNCIVKCHHTGFSCCKLLPRAIPFTPGVTLNIILMKSYTT